MVIGNRKRKRDLRDLRKRSPLPVNTDRHGILRLLRSRGLTANESRGYTNPTMLKRDLLEEFLQGINRDTQAKLDERIRDIVQEVQESVSKR